VAGVLCVQPYWITCGWLISRRCRQPTRNALRADQGGFKSLLIQGRCPAEYLALLPSHTARVITSARSGKLCAMDLQSDQKMGSISAHMHSCMHCGRAKRYHGCRCAPDAAVCRHGVERCPVQDKDFGQSMDWDASPDALVLSILSPEWEDKPSRETKVLYWNAVATLFRPLAEACRILRMTRTTALVLKILRATY
jgi:hypothetical protein